VGDKTSIGWTDATWNPTTGCDRISPGCLNCYALTMAGRLKLMGSARYQTDGDPRTSGPGFGLALHPDVLDQPLRWKRSRRIFVDSMSDLFHDEVPAAFIADVINVMARCPQHVFQVLTKWPQRMARVLDDLCWDGQLPNVHLGTSIESDAYTFRSRHLRRVPAAVRFLSLEPLLGPLPSLDLTGIGWVIVGAESGHGARPMDLGWVRAIRDHAVERDIPLFFKQAADANGHKILHPELDGRTWEQFPS
jgi:protein gp37